MRQTLDVTAPMHDRRRGRRVLTIKNFAIFVLVLAFVFGAVNIVSELRRPRRGDYGRLFGREVKRESVKPTAPQPIVAEAEVEDREHADPTLLAPAAREQYLGETELTPQPVVAPPPVSEADVAWTRPAPLLQTGKKITITNEAGGLRVVQQ
jgi:hypothetical protein